MSQEDMDRLPGDLWVLAPAESFVRDFNGSGKGTLLFLSPELEDLSQEEVNFEVAIMFARAFLTVERVIDGEDARAWTVDAMRGLLSRWGFELDRNVTEEHLEHMLLH
jgi:hypothetical protein